MLATTVQSFKTAATFLRVTKPKELTNECIRIHRAYDTQSFITYHLSESCCCCGCLLVQLFLFVRLFVCLFVCLLFLIRNTLWDYILGTKLVLTMQVKGLPCHTSCELFLQLLIPPVNVVDHFSFPTSLGPFLEVLWKKTLLSKTRDISVKDSKILLCWLTHAEFNRRKKELVN